MRMNRLNTLVAIIILLTLTIKSYAQQESSKPTWWTSFSAGVLQDKNYVLSADLNLALSKSTLVFLMGDYRHDFIEGDNYPRYDAMGTSLGFGKYLKKKNFLISLSGGLSFDLVNEQNLFIDSISGFGYINTTTGIEFGLPLRFYSFIHLDKIGIGFHALYKVTLYDSYGSVGISFTFGNFKKT